MPSTQPTGWVRWHAAIPICLFCGRSGSDRRLDHKSRMGREFHVRFREGLGVKSARATRLVICCRGSAAEALAAVRAMMSKLGLTVNETKTRCCRVPEETFNFLGYTFGRNYSYRTGRSYVGPRPSAKKVQALCAGISALTGRKWTWLDTEDLVGRLNRRLVGWANYFCLGNVGRAYQRVMAHTCFRLRQWLGRKHRVQRTSRSRFTFRYLREDLGLVWLPERPRPGSLWANS